MQLPDLSVRFFFSLQSQLSVLLDSHSQKALRELQYQYALPPDLIERVQIYLLHNSARFSLKDLLEGFVSEVVSGAGFSSQDEDRFYQAAASILDSPRESIADFNLVGPHRPSPEQLEQLDRALFHQGYLNDLHQRRLSQQVSLSGAQLSRICQTHGCS